MHRWFTEPGHETSSSSTLIFDTRETVASWQKRDDRRIRNRGFNPPTPASDRSEFFFLFFFFPHSAPFENKRDQIYIYIYNPYTLYTSIDCCSSNLLLYILISLHAISLDRRPRSFHPSDRFPKSYSRATGLYLKETRVVDRVKG